MELTPEQKVKKYLRTQRKGRLTFGDKVTSIYSSKIKPLDYPRRNYTLKNLIKFVLKAAFDREIIERGKVQCHAGARHSAVDIWRMVKTYQPDVDLFSVMRTLYTMTRRDKTYDMDFCSTIEKRVFDMEDEPEGHEWGIEDEDEFGLMWKDWRRIGL